MIENKERRAEAWVLAIFNDQAEGRRVNKEMQENHNMGEQSAECPSIQG